MYLTLKKIIADLDSINLVGLPKFLQNKLGMSPGEVVFIKGKENCLGRVVSNENFFITEWIAYNCNVKLGDKIRLERVNVNFARKVIFERKIYDKVIYLIPENTEPVSLLKFPNKSYVYSSLLHLFNKKDFPIMVGLKFPTIDKITNELGGISTCFIESGGKRKKFDISYETLRKMSENSTTSEGELIEEVKNNKSTDFIVSEVKPKCMSLVHADTKIFFDDKFFFGKNNNLVKKHYLFSYFPQSGGSIKFEKEIVDV